MHRGPPLAQSTVFPFHGTAHLSEFYSLESSHRHLERIADNALTYLSKEEDLSQANEVSDFDARPERANLRTTTNAQRKKLQEESMQVDELLHAELRHFNRNLPSPDQRQPRRG